MVDIAKSKIGKIKYLFGAEDIEHGYADCSSFTEYVYKQSGIDIGRDTITQMSKSQVVEKSDLKSGDLVFFKDTYRSGVSHVGIYSGNGKFIHNSSSRGTVIESSLDDPYWKNHWLSGGRVGVKPPEPTIVENKKNETKIYNENSDLDEIEPEPTNFGANLITIILIIGLILLSMVFITRTM